MDVEEKSLSLRKIWEMVRPSFQGTSMRYTGIIFLLVLASLGSFAEPILYGKIIDALVAGVSGGVSERIWETIALLLGAWVVIDIVSSASRELANFFSWKTADKVWLHFWKRTLERVLFWDPQRFTQKSLGGLGKQLDTSGSAVWRLAGTTLQQIFPAVFGSVAFFVVGGFLDWRMTLASLAGIPPLFFMTFIAQRAVKQKQDDMNAAWETFLEKLIEIFTNIIPIKSFATEKDMAALHMRIGKDAAEKQRKVNAFWALLGFGTSFARFFGRFFLLGAGLFFIAQGTLTLGTLITFLGMLNIVLAPFEHMLTEVMRKVSETRSAFARIYPDTQVANTIIEPKKPYAPKRILGDLVFEDVSYTYPEKTEKALKNISLTIPRGTSLALVGPSGSGKSTLVKFVNRFLDPTEGAIFLDGKDLKEFSLSTLRKSIGFVHQESVLFNASVRENLLFVRPDATKQEIIFACKQAQAHGFIMKLPQKYDTIIGERGVRLSGGERQRLAIARVFLAHQPVLVLDESTSALDSETEAKLQQALKKAMNGRTSIIIAHRLSTIYMADAIAVMDKGALVEYGTHAELLKGGGLYERLWGMQSGGYVTE